MRDAFERERGRKKERKMRTCYVLCVVLVCVFGSVFFFMQFLEESEFKRISKFFCQTLKDIPKNPYLFGLTTFIKSPAISIRI